MNGVTPSGDRLLNSMKIERARHNLTQEQLADIVGVTRKTINTVERGIFIPSTVLALKLARALSVPVEELFQLEASKQKDDSDAVRAEYISNV